MKKFWICWAQISTPKIVQSKRSLTIWRKLRKELLMSSWVRRERKFKCSNSKLWLKTMPSKIKLDSYLKSFIKDWINIENITVGIFQRKFHSRKMILLGSWRKRKRNLKKESGILKQISWSSINCMIKKWPIFKKIFKKWM